jgi:hypothetical protein
LPGPIREQKEIEITRKHITCFSRSLFGNFKVLKSFLGSNFYYSNPCQVRIRQQATAFDLTTQQIKALPEELIQNILAAHGQYLEDAYKKLTDKNAAYKKRIQDLERELAEAKRQQQVHLLICISLTRRVRGVPRMEARVHQAQQAHQATSSPTKKHKYLPITFRLGTRGPKCR